MFTFTDKNGRTIQVTAKVASGWDTAERAEDILLGLLKQVPPTEYIMEPAK